MAKYTLKLDGVSKQGYEGVKDALADAGFTGIPDDLPDSLAIEVEASDPVRVADSTALNEIAVRYGLANPEKMES